MFKLRIEFNGSIIIERIISIDKIDLEKIVDLFREHFNLDINKYRLSEFHNEPGIFTLKIRAKDLEKMRNDKLKSIGL